MHVPSWMLMIFHKSRQQLSSLFALPSRTRTVPWFYSEVGSRTVVFGLPLICIIVSIQQFGSSSPSSQMSCWSMGVLRKSRASRVSITGSPGLRVVHGVTPTGWHVVGRDHSEAGDQTEKEYLALWCTSWHPWFDGRQEGFQNNKEIIYKLKMHAAGK